MELRPPQYECSTHHKDLTELVIDALDDGPPLFYEVSRLQLSHRGARKFKVVVTCPGAEPDGPAHPLTCTGIRS